MPTGRVLWSFDMGTEVPTPPAVVDGTVYLGAGLRGVVALDAETGDLLWQFSVAGKIQAAVAVAGDKAVQDGNLVVGGQELIDGHAADITGAADDKEPHRLPFRGRSSRRRVTGPGCHCSDRLNTRQAFWPPKPKLFLSTIRASISRAPSGT